MPANLAKLAYTREDVCRMLAIPGPRLRSWQRQGFLPASGDFTFSDLIAIKTLQKLRESRVPPKRIARALAALKRKLSGVERPLSELRIISDGKSVAVQIAGQKMEAITGQLLFDFDTAELAAVETLPERSQAPPPNPAVQRVQSEQWFQRGLALEEAGAPIEQAVEAYRHAVELNPKAAGALVNLGTIYYHMQRLRDAEFHYMAAIGADPNYPLAHFNAANLYDERGDMGRALEHYKTALRLDPAYADAHYNIALLYEKSGDFLRAQHHWKTYLKLDRTSSWAQVARKQLEKLRRATVVDGAGK